MIDLDAAIIPGTAAAGIAVGASIDGILSVENPSEIAVLNDALKCSFGSVVLWARHGLVHQVGVRSGYRGLLATGIGIGSSIAQVEAAFNAAVIEDDQDNLVVEGSTGWCFETKQWAAPYTAASNRAARITQIFVYGNTAFKAQRWK